jgi:hypothetical protein
MRAAAPADQKLNLRHLWQATWRPPYRRRIRWLILIDERLAENGKEPGGLHGPPILFKVG